MLAPVNPAGYNTERNIGYSIDDSNGWLADDALQWLRTVQGVVRHGRNTALPRTAAGRWALMLLVLQLRGRCLMSIECSVGEEA